MSSSGELAKIDIISELLLKQSLHTSWKLAIMKESSILSPLLYRTSEEAERRRLSKTGRLRSVCETLLHR